MQNLLEANAFGAAEPLADEQYRLTILDQYDILDTPKEEIFDRITRMACRLLDIEMSTITFVDGHRQWFKSCVGVDSRETAREPSFCQYAIRFHNALIVPNTLADTRFKSNSLVTGAPFIRSYAGVPLAPNNGPALGTLCVLGRNARSFDATNVENLRDLASMAEAALELRSLATIDSLTGCLTRRAFRERLSQALSLGLRHSHNVSLMLFDIDHFKRINDTHGHAAGDEVLRGVAEICRQNLRSSDFIGRVGGEEFALALPHTERASAINVAELLRIAIQSAPFEVNGQQISATASFGVTSLSATGDEVDSIMASADGALYRAKNAGRNRIFAACDVPKAEDNGRRVLKAGLIVCNAGSSIIECTVRRLSDTGAHLQIVPQVTVPDMFKLRIDADNYSRVCHVTDRKDTDIVVSIANTAN